MVGEKNKWYWYVARADELMMDCDGRTLLEIACKRLDRLDRDIGLGRLPVLPEIQSIFVVNSTRPDHFHFVVRLKYPLPVLWRMVWQLYLMDHVYRSVKNLFRALEGVSAPSLLISPVKWPTTGGKGKKPHAIVRPDGGGIIPAHFWRHPDTVCRCESHKNQERIHDCPAHKRLRVAIQKESTIVIPKELGR